MPILKRTNKTLDPKTGKPKVTYLVRVEGPPDPVTGKRQQWAKTVDTKAEAKSLDVKWQADVNRGTAIAPSDMIMSELLDAWVRSVKGQVSSNTYTDYAATCRNHIKPVLGGMKVQRVTTQSVQTFYDDMVEEGRSARLVRGCHLRLNQAFDYAERMGLVVKNPCRATKPPRIERRTVQTWSADEVAAFMETAESRRDRLWPLWPLLVLEGMRRGEALGLRWRDIDFQRGVVTIQQVVVVDAANKQKPVILPRTKTSAGTRSLEVTSRTLEALKEHRKHQNAVRLAASRWEDNDLVTCTRYGTPISPPNVTRAFKALVKATVLDDGTPLRLIRVHDQRHTSATILMAAGVPVKAVSERLGHASPEITLDFYGHVTPAMRDQAATTMNDLTRKKPTGCRCR